MRKRITNLLIFMVFGVSGLLMAQPAQVPKTNPTKVYMHYMPWYDAPENPVAGGNYSWGWHWTMNTRNPNIIDGSGKRQIASHYYPIIGPYASKDPHVVEYHLLLMKLSGIDGVLVDWYGSEGSNPDVGSLLTNSNALIDRTDEVGIKFGLIMEDRFWGSIQNGRNSMAYARNNYFNRSHFIRHGAGNDPLVGIFGPITYQSPSQWSDILSYAGEDVEFLPLWYESGDGGSSADGEYAWIYSDYLSGLTNFYANRATGLKTAMGVAYPGFHDYYVEGGSGSSYFYIPENNGATLNETLNTYDQYKGNLDFLQLATWNDFGEGTIFEPTLENGYKYLVRIQQYTGVPYTENDLKQVHRLFTLRKKYLNDGTKQSQLNTAFNHFVALRINDAVAVMNSVDGGTPPPPPAAIAIPGTMQAESYLAMSGIQTETTADAGGGTNVGWIDANDWMDYNVNVTTSGTYNVSFRVSSGVSGGQLQLRKGGTTLASITVPGTGGWQNWTTVTATANLTAGSQTLRLHAVTSGYNINWVRFETASAPPPPSAPIPGTIQAENYSGMNGVQTENTTDAGGGLNVGWIDANDWMDYNVNVASSGTYNVKFRVASGTSGGQLQLRKGGTTLATITVPGTGNWQNWTTISTTANLSSGTQTLRLYAVSGGYNINWIEFATGSTPPPPSGTTYYIKNRWQNNYLYDDNSQVRYGTAPTSNNNYKWELVNYNGHTRIKNTGSGRFMNIENQLSYVESTSLPETFYSGYWVIEDYDGHKRIRNEWQNTYLHEENLTGFAQCSAISAGAWSNQWLLVNSSTFRIGRPEALNDQKGLQVYPNPVITSLNIKIDESDKFHTLSLTNSQGKEVLRKKVEGEQHDLDLSSVTEGIYILKLEGASSTKFIKVFKK
ncbi:MAG TPA: carbohydrate-binding protein [Cytophagales bacterium]|nr:carbohydrate-binding protein [Cytophagales bacterium]